MSEAEVRAAALRPRAGDAPAARVTSFWLIAPVVALAAFMEVLDIAIANVALRHIAGDLSAGQDESTWVLTSYLITNAIVLPASGWLSSVLGRKRFFVGCIAGFTASSLICGLAPNLTMLIVFRALQGLTGGGLQPAPRRSSTTRRRRRSAAWRSRCTAWRWCSRRRSARRSAAGSPTMPAGAGCS
jgi:MFS family permease